MPKDHFPVKVTDEIKEKARAMFEMGIQSCSDIAASVGVSESTLRKYFPKECNEATDRNLSKLKDALNKEK